MKYITKIIRGFIATASLAFLVNGASAHTTSLGSYNAGSPGSVTIAMGSYHNGAATEGFIQLISGPGTPIPGTPAAFNTATSIKPIQLIDGTNNFYAPLSGGALSQFDQGTSPFGPSTHPDRWQTATFMGLLPGTYTYQVTGMNSVNWSEWNNNVANFSGSIVITGVVAGVPDGGSTAIMLGLPLLIMGTFRKLRR